MVSLTRNALRSSKKLSTAMKNTMTNRAMAQARLVYCVVSTMYSVKMVAEADYHITIQLLLL